MRERPQTSEDYVRMAYWVLLRREIDAAGLRAWRESIATGNFREQSVINAILGSDEYLIRFGIDLLRIVHRARQAWIGTLAPFERILDIGGSSPTRPEGAMIELGYPHRPRRLDILDRPPEQQYWGVPRYDQSRPAIFDWGEVRYFHASGEQVGGVAGLQQELYDCVFLGQAIEHIRPEALPGMLAWIRRHLTPNGRLIFDTPNRLLTKIQCPNSYIDPDHKREYAPTELQEVLEANGFVVSVRTGMVHLPVQALSGRFDKREFVGAEQLSEDVDRCYLFAFEATSSTT